MKKSQLKTQWPWFYLSMSSKAKFYMVNWEAIYDLLYAFHTNFDHTMYRLWDTTCWTLCDPYLTFQCHIRSKVFNVNWKIIYDFAYVFHRNIGHGTHRFWDIGPNRSLRSKLDISDLENNLLGNSIPFIF